MEESTRSGHTIHDLTTTGIGHGTPDLRSGPTSVDGSAVPEMRDDNQHAAQNDAQSPESNVATAYLPSDEAEKSPISPMSDTSSEDESPLARSDSKYLSLTASTRGSQLSRMQSGKSSAAEAEAFKVLSRKRSSATGRSEADLEQDQAEIERLMSRMYL